ncbi:MAG: mechanosensitive ion channel [Gammaproteobacteria bacterium]|nr:mechanosensitive ion channel [Gammaproteobacteria bacterium]MCI0590432.1 mechanosensitive ion channel [Gammaproteobacteria bacterium]
MDTYNNWTSLLRNSFTEFVQALAEYLPSLIVALVLLVIGWLLARLMRTLILRFGAGIDRLVAATRKRTGQSALQARWPLSRIAANVIFWLVILFFVTAAAESLGLPGLADWLGQLIVYLPKVLAGGVIVLIGYFLGALARDVVIASATSKRMVYAVSLGHMIQVIIITFAVVLGVGQLDLNIHLLVNVITIVAAAIFGGAALAFGLGAGTSVSNIIASYDIRRAYRVGQRIRVNGIEGEILELTPTAVVLDTQEGRALIPAKVFIDNASILIGLEDDTDA